MDGNRIEAETWKRNHFDSVTEWQVHGKTIFTRPKKPSVIPPLHAIIDKNPWTVHETIIKHERFRRP